MEYWINKQKEKGINNIVIPDIRFKHEAKYLKNIGFENLSIINIAKKISRIIKSEIVIKKNYKDARSYNLDSSKLLKTGYKPKKISLTQF